jgi:hypothetical protein
MKCHLVLLALIALPLQSIADPVVGFATLVEKGLSPTQPNACAKLPKEERGGCIEFSYERVYEVRGFVDVMGHEVRIETMVKTGHSSVEGQWFLVLEVMSPQDQKTYGARYRFVDGGGIGPVACTRHDVNQYIKLPNDDEFADFIDGDRGHCYSVPMLRKWIDEPDDPYKP